STSWTRRDRTTRRTAERGPSSRLSADGAAVPESVAANVPERPFGGGHELLDFPVAHRSREATEPRRVQQHTGVEEPAEQAVHPRLGGLIDVAVAPGRPVGEHESEERALAGHLAGHAGGAEDLADTRAQPRAERLQPVECIRRHRAHRCETPRHADRVRAECPAGGDPRTSRARVEHLHDFRAAAGGADGKAAPDDLAKRGEIGVAAVAALGAAVANSEGDDLVEDEKHPSLARDL